MWNHLRVLRGHDRHAAAELGGREVRGVGARHHIECDARGDQQQDEDDGGIFQDLAHGPLLTPAHRSGKGAKRSRVMGWPPALVRSEEHTSELQSLMRISYAVFCLKKKKKRNKFIDSTTSYYHYTEQSNI